MKIKKLIAAFAVCALIGSAMTPIAVSAHSHGGGHHSKTSSDYSVCTRKDCHKSGNHSHKGTSYQSRCAANGHDHN